MKRYLLIALFFCIPLTTRAAVTYDNGDFQSASGASVTASFAIDACSDRVLYVWASNYKSGGVSSGPTSVTYNGVALTQFSTENSFSSGQIKENVWYLSNPNTGSHNITVTAPTSVDEIDYTAVSYCGADPSGPQNPQAYNDTATNHEFTFTTTVSSWLATVGRNRIDEMSSYGSGTALRRVPASGAIMYGDSNGGLSAGTSHIGLGTTGSSEMGLYAWEILAQVGSGGGGGTGTTTTATTTEVMYGDWLLMNSWFLFLLGLLTLGFFFQTFKKKPTWI